MEINRRLNEDKTYDYYLKEGNKTLKIFFAGNLDLYMSMSCNEKIKPNVNKSIPLDITKENYELFNIFNNLYNEIILNKPYEDEELNYYRYEYKLLVNKKIITWVSDDEPLDCADRFSLIKVDDDTIRFIFNRVDKEFTYFKSALSISVRLRNSGSRYEPYNIPFMKMYRKLQSIDPKYHQIHLEELNYKKRSLHK